MSRYEDLQDRLRAKPSTWLVTGAAGFIGSNLVERLLELGQTVVALDNFATGKRQNIEGVRAAAGASATQRLRFVEADIRDLEACRAACAGVDLVLHQAALGSVPRSIDDPIASHAANVSGFLNVLVAAREAGVRQLVYASSSSVYGDHPDLPKVEETVGRPLSPYATTKVVNELYARNFRELYGMRLVGLRYFNVFGPRQDPDGAYAAVIPRWIGRIQAGETCEIYGDGTTSRDFCYIDNAVQANLLAGTSDAEGAAGAVYNVACGARISLTELYQLIRAQVVRLRPELAMQDVVHATARPGDVQHSLADISKARRLLGYEPTVASGEGIDRTVAWFFNGG